MADDSMEISSEHGHNGGDGDIDIDFDFASAQVDEDYVLEDAALTADFEGDYHPQPSPAIGNDDLMIDEDVNSYPMDDADLLRDEDGHTMEHAPLPVATEESLQLGEDQTDGAQFGANDSNDAADYMYAHQAQDVESDAFLGNSGDDPHREDLQSAEVAALNIERSSTDLTHYDTRTASPFQGSPQSAGSARGRRSPPASSSEREPVSPDHTSNHPENNLTSTFLSADAINAVETASLDGTTLLVSPRDVMVVYQSVEYALFSSSELDDPDSFFLSDISIAEKPLPDLFKTIRQVIQEDLSDEDELCMAVEDLGIEIEERSSTLLHDVTLIQILNLREKLLRNDGVESVRPLYIILGTRINFTKRLEKLTAGAAEGKGLSELVPWDEHSESLDDLGEADESKYDVESTVEDQEVDIVPDVEESADRAAQTTENSPPDELIQEYEQGSIPDPVEDTKIGPVESVPVSRDGSAKESTTTDVKLPIQEDAKQSGNPSSEVYDEDDLIDYSEEEGDNTSAVQRHVKPHHTDENRTNHEYEAINKNLRRRSISRTTEDRIFEQSNEQAPVATEDDNEGTYVEENGIEYEEKNEFQEEFQNGDLNAVHEDFSTEHFDTSGHLEQYGDASFLTDEFGGEEEFTDEVVVGDSFDVFGTEAQDYDDYGDEGALEDSNGDHHSLQRDGNGAGDIRESERRSSPPGLDVTEENLEQADTAESSVTVGADEIQYEDGPDEEIFDNSKTTTDSQALNGGTEHPVEAEHEDEIDYEDDEKRDGKGMDAGVATPLPAAPVMPTSNGKRSREDAESDNAFNMRGNEAKRPRS